MSIWKVQNHFSKKYTSDALNANLKSTEELYWSTHIHIDKRNKEHLSTKSITASTDVTIDENSREDIIAWSYDVHGHAQKFVERDGE